MTTAFTELQPVEVMGQSINGDTRWDAAKIWRITKDMRPMPDGYMPVKFDSDGQVMLIPVEALRKVTV